MSEIRRKVKIKNLKDNLSVSIPKEITSKMGIIEGEQLEIKFNENNPNLLELNKIDMESNKFWFIIGDQYWWGRQIRDGYWDLDNKKSPDLKLFESIKPIDVILAYSKNPSKYIQNILITKKGFDPKNGTIDIQNIRKLKKPITFEDFGKLNILSEYRKMPRRSIVPVSEGDFKKIINTISKREKIDFKSILLQNGVEIDIGKCTSEGYLNRAIHKYLNRGIDKDKYNDVNFEESIKFLNKAIEKDPNGSLHKFIKSLILQEIGKVEDDLSGSFEGYLEMGLLKYQSEKYDESLEYLNKSIRINPHADIPRYIKGLIFEKMGNFEGALKSYEMAFIINPDNPDPLINIGNIKFNCGDLDEALESYKKACEIDPDDPEPLYNMGIVFHDKKRYEEAIFYNDEAIRKDPTYYKALCNNGIILNDHEKWNEALDYFNRSLEINPNDWICLLNKAKAYKLKGDNKKAIQSYEKALKLEPESEDIKAKLEECKQL
jgi:tetratricopeptide (TPR) repeat protein